MARRKQTYLEALQEVMEDVERLDFIARTGAKIITLEEGHSITINQPATQVYVHTEQFPELRDCIDEARRKYAEEMSWRRKMRDLT